MIWSTAQISVSEYLIPDMVMAEGNNEFIVSSNVGNTSLKGCIDIWRKLISQITSGEISASNQEVTTLKDFTEHDSSAS